MLDAIALLHASTFPCVVGSGATGYIEVQILREDRSLKERFSLLLAKTVRANPRVDENIERELSRRIIRGNHQDT